MTTIGETSPRSARPVSPARARLSPLGIREVRLDSEGFWGGRIELNAEAIIPHCLHWQERSSWLGNFDAAVAGTLPDARRGREFADSETYKLLEAMAWQIETTGDAAMDSLFTTLVERVGRAQEPDGYLNTNYGRPGQAPRYSNLAWGHELYNSGHLLQAAVARARTAGRDQLFDIAVRVADHICETFGPDGLDAVCGHPEVELGLVEFGRVTGDERYIEQARLFVERRGHGLLPDIEFGRSYYQDDIPVREATVLRGHAVRALYLSAAAVDVAVETEDAELLRMLEQQWSNTVARRTYITGGMGSHHQDEGFGEDFELPSDRAYCETCAGVASVMFSWRLLLATGDPKYADLIERTLFNIVATSPAPDGRSFFYANTLQQRVPGLPSNPDEQSPRAISTMRAPWFDVACCPNNVARMFASLPAYVATVGEDSLQIHLYSAGRIETVLGNGDRVSVEVATEYPHDGRITLTVIESPERPWGLQLRIPAWSEGSTIVVNGVAEPATGATATIERAFLPGDTIELDLDFQPRIIEADPRVDAVRGTVAVEVGPLVYCLESVDLPAGARLDGVNVDGSTPTRIGSNVVMSGVYTQPTDEPWAYRSDPGARAGGTRLEFPLMPYHEWANRGPSTMRVWMRAGS